MLGRSGGRAYLEFLVEGEASQAWVDRHLLRPLDPTASAEQLTRRGAAIVSLDEVDLPRRGPDESADSDTSRRRVCRMVVEWTS